MRCLAIIEAQRPGLDSVIVWEKDGLLIAFAYQDGRVQMTRPLAATDLDGAFDEVRINFQINTGQLTRITEASAQPERLTTPRTRW